MLGAFLERLANLHNIHTVASNHLIDVVSQLQNFLNSAGMGANQFKLSVDELNLIAIKNFANNGDTVRKCHKGLSRRKSAAVR